MTKQEVRALLLKSAGGEHGAYVLHLFEDFFGDEKIASIKTRLNRSKNNSKQKHYKAFTFNTQKQS